jgi:hypothetical protein
MTADNSNVVSNSKTFNVQAFLDGAIVYQQNQDTSSSVSRTDLIAAMGILKGNLLGAEPLAIDVFRLLHKLEIFPFLLVSQITDLNKEIKIYMNLLYLCNVNNLTGKFNDQNLMLSTDYHHAAKTGELRSRIIDLSQRLWVWYRDLAIANPNYDVSKSELMCLAFDSISDYHVWVKQLKSSGGQYPRHAQVI